MISVKPTLHRLFEQSGLALLALIGVIALLASMLFVTYLNNGQIRIERDKKTAQAIASAKSSLLGWSVGHPNYPGIMLFPDRNADGNYDGNSDCVAAGLLNYSHLIGRLPNLGQTAPCVSPLNGLSGHFLDGDGEPLWYAVSRNLIRTTAAGPLVINTSIINSPIYPWLIVRDKNGQIISDRVAVVILAPGRVVGSQNRSGGLASPAEYLDSLIIGITPYSNADSNVPNEDFIMAEDSQHVANPHPFYAQPYQFNDKLIYITIDELILKLEQRVFAEVRNALITYYQSMGVYPYADSSADSDTMADAGLLNGVPSANGDSTSLSFTPETKDALENNLWFTLINYNVSSDQQQVTLTLGTKTMIVRP